MIGNNNGATLERVVSTPARRVFAGGENVLYAQRLEKQCDS